MTTTHLPQRCRRSQLRLPESATDRAYLAGIIDGEGSIGVLYDHPLPFVRNRVSVVVVNTDQGLLDWLSEIGGRISRSTNAMRWEVTARAEVIELLAAVIPYMRIKREVAELALRHAEERMAS